MTEDRKVDEFYRGYRIAIKQTDGWVARITHVRGTHIPLSAKATEKEGRGALPRAGARAGRPLHRVSRPQRHRRRAELTPGQAGLASDDALTAVEADQQQRRQQR